jgi:hypothetical protein
MRLLRDLDGRDVVDILVRRLVMLTPKRIGHVAAQQGGRHGAGRKPGASAETALLSAA